MVTPTMDALRRPPNLDRPSAQTAELNVRAWTRTGSPALFMTRSTTEARVPSASAARFASFPSGTSLRSVIKQGSDRLLAGGASHSMRIPPPDGTLGISVCVARLDEIWAVVISLHSSVAIMQGLDRSWRFRLRSRSLGIGVFD